MRTGMAMEWGGGRYEYRDDELEVESDASTVAVDRRLEGVGGCCRAAAVFAAVF